MLNVLLYSKYVSIIQECNCFYQYEIRWYAPNRWWFWACVLTYERILKISSWWRKLSRENPIGIRESQSPEDPWWKCVNFEWISELYLGRQRTWNLNMMLWNRRTSFQLCELLVPILIFKGCSVGNLVGNPSKFIVCPVCKPVEFTKAIDVESKHEGNLAGTLHAYFSDGWFNHQQTVCF